MDCTACTTGRLVPSFLEPQFRCHTCSGCGGNWILIEDYLAWKERQPGFEASPTQPAEVDSDDTSRALLCPVTGTIMGKFRIASGNSHRIDYSPRVGGVWLDRGEWALLVNEGLAGSLNAILTDPWQHRVRLEGTQESLQAMHRAKFGEDDYRRACEIRDWLDGHALKDELRRFILAGTPGR